MCTFKHSALTIIKMLQLFTILYKVHQNFFAILPRRNNKCPKSFFLFHSFHINKKLVNAKECLWSEHDLFFEERAQTFVKRTCPTNAKKKRLKMKIRRWNLLKTKLLRVFRGKVGIRIVIKPPHLHVLLSHEERTFIMTWKAQPRDEDFCEQNNILCSHVSQRRPSRVFVYFRAVIGQ